MKALIVDDEPLARARLSRLLTQLQAFEQILVAEDVQHALQLNQQFRPEVVFLDIAMPGLNGLQLAERLSATPLPPALIYVTAHPEHALDAYSTAPLDYLLKPVNSARLSQAIARLDKPTRLNPEPLLRSNEVLSGQCGGVKRQLSLRQVQYLKAEDKYVRAVGLAAEELLLEQSLQQLLERYPQSLLRIHRSVVINKMYFKALINKNNRHYIALQNSDELLEVSRRLLGAVKAALNLE
jgi:two-component system response regulator AlgR